MRTKSFPLVAQSQSQTWNRIVVHAQADAEHMLACEIELSRGRRADLYINPWVAGKSFLKALSLNFAFFATTPLFLMLTDA